MTYEALALLLMIVGFALIVAEVFIPSGGMILILCVISFASSIWSAHKAWWGVQPGLFWVYIAALVVLIPSATVAAFRFLENSPFGRRVLLTAPTHQEVVPHRVEVSRLTALVGAHGTALTLMTPGGMVSVQGERLHAESEGQLIDPGTPVEVAGVRGTRVLVRPVTTGAAGTSVAGAPAGSTESPAPLDFDFPQG